MVAMMPTQCVIGAYDGQTSGFDGHAEATEIDFTKRSRVEARVHAAAIRFSGDGCEVSNAGGDVLRLDARRRRADQVRVLAVVFKNCAAMVPLRNRQLSFSVGMC